MRFSNSMSRRIKNSMMILAILGVLCAVGIIVNDDVAAANVTGEDIVREALRYEGNPVQMNSAKGVQYIFEKQGIQLPGTLSALSQEGQLISKGQALRQGDIVFFGNSASDLIAAGVYLGNNQFIASYEPYKTIRVMNLNDAEPKKYYLGAKRVLPDVTQTSLRDQIIDEGLKYLGTPYEFGSNRSSTRTMDCSAFVRRTYHDATGEYIGRNSRAQAAYVQANGTTTTNWRNLSKGDLMFFTSPSTGRIYHVAIYMGDGKMLHTYSVKSGGVRVDSVSGFWDRQFTFGGSLLD